MGRRHEAKKKLAGVPTCLCNSMPQSWVLIRSNEFAHYSHRHGRTGPRGFAKPGGRERRSKLAAMARAPGERCRTQSRPPDHLERRQQCEMETEASRIRHFNADHLGKPGVHSNGGFREQTRAQIVASRCAIRRTRATPTPSGRSWWFWVRKAKRTVSVCDSL